MTSGLPSIRDLLAAESEWLPQPVLGGYGAAMLALVPAGLVWARRDPRTIDGESVALKPIRFALSIGVYLLTASAMFALVRPDRRSALPSSAAVWMMTVGSTVELACIGLQAARARRSHFNNATPGDAVIYATMGAFAVLFIGGVFPLAWEIARRPDPLADGLAVQATVAGLLMTGLVGGGTGGLISGRGGSVTRRQGRRLPLFGWSMSGDDLRIPHFFGIHAMQALPLISAGASVVNARRAPSLFAAGAVGYALLTAGLLYRALTAKPATKD